MQENYIFLCAINVNTVWDYFIHISAFHKSHQRHLFSLFFISGVTRVE